MVTPAAKVNRPSISISLVGRVAMQMLSLLHVNAGNLVSLHLGVPGATPLEGSFTGSHVQFFPLVEANAIRVCFGEAESISLSGDRGSLDGAIQKLLGVRGAARGRSPHVHVELLHEGRGSLCLGDRTDGGDGLLSDHGHFRHHTS